MTLDEALAEIEHMRALLEASAMLDRDKDAEIERLKQVCAAMKERCARVAEAQIRTWGGSPAALIATAIRNLPDTDGDGT